MLKFSFVKFSDLTLYQLYELLAARAKIFVVEQQALYLDADNKDQKAIHLLGYEDNLLVAYLRIFPPTSECNEVVFGRVLVATISRGKGYGKKLLQEFLSFCSENFPEKSIRCSAQLYLQDFYEEFGFTTHGDSYLEDNIPHIDMIRMINQP